MFVPPRFTDPKLGRQTFEDFAKMWADAQDWKRSTRESFGPHLRRIVACLGRKRSDQIEPLDLHRLRNELSATYARSTTAITLHYAMAIMRAAYQAGRIARDPTMGVKPPRRRR